MKIYFFIKKLINSVKKVFLEVFIPNKKARKVLKATIAKNYLKKYVNIVIKNDLNKNEIVENNPYIIWQYWDKGYNNAPKIVQKCINSIDKFSNEKHIILDFKSIEDYVEIPSKFYDLLKQKKMKPAHFSDILRTLLLVHHGGCWMDSTLLLTDKMPDYIKNSDIFLFQNYEKQDVDGLSIANYFISSKKGNKILKDTYSALLEYWKDNDFVVNYFFYLHIFTMLLKDEKNKEIWQNTPFKSFFPVQYFQKHILEKYSIEKYNQIKLTSYIHKLSFKNKVLGLKGEIPDNSFLDKLLKDELI